MNKLFVLVKAGCAKVASLCKKGALCAAVVLAGGSLFAQGSTETTTAFDDITGKVADWAETITESIKDFFVDNFDTLMILAGVALGITVLWVVIRWFTKGTKKIG